MSKSLQWLVLPDGMISFNIIQDLRREYEEPAVDPATAFGFFAKAHHLCAFRDQSSKAPSRANRRYCCQGLLALMERDKILEIEIRDSVSVSEAKNVVIQIFSYTFKPAAGHRFH